MTARILVSACLLGRPVRYDGSARTLADRTIDVWAAQGRLVAICPELAAGLPVPRPAAEIADGRGGGDVWAGTGCVVEANGTDVTALYRAGAEAALALAIAQGCRLALLTDGSPSCGSGFIHDGAFAGRRHPGIGVTTALLRSHGIEVFAESEIEALAAVVSRIEWPALP